MHRASPPELVEVPLGTGVPRVIHQVFSRGALPPALAENRRAIQDMNPGWRTELHDGPSMLEFVREVYGTRVVEYLKMIDPRYAPARADLFRYLLIYKLGGVYLDIKSTTTRPLDDVLLADDAFLLSQWNNGPDEEHRRFGLHSELASVPGGEYQQWWMASAPGHPYLRAVIQNVLSNLDDYRPWRHGVGKNGVLRLTGPIAYTKAIRPIEHDHQHRWLSSRDDLGLTYSILPGMTHAGLFANNYQIQTVPVVRARGLHRWVNSGYTALRVVYFSLRGGSHRRSSASTRVPGPLELRVERFHRRLEKLLKR